MARVWPADGTGEILVLRGHIANGVISPSPSAPDGIGASATSFLLTAHARVWRRHLARVEPGISARERPRLPDSGAANEWFLAETAHRSTPEANYAACERAKAAKPVLSGEENL